MYMYIYILIYIIVPPINLREDKSPTAPSEYLQLFYNLQQLYFKLF